jgi:hypothetical protein
LLAGWLAACGAEPTPPTSGDAAPTGQRLGFVVTRWQLPIPEADPATCPRGLNPNEADYHGFTPEQRRDAVRPEFETQPIAGHPDTCRNPEAFPDPGFLTAQGDGPVVGLDLDGLHSSRAEPGPDTCPHDDFRGVAGERGIDNQFWRLVGCVRGYQPGHAVQSGESSSVNIKDGSFTLLFEITGVDDIRSDDAIAVRVFSSRDGVQLDGAGNILPGSSHSVHEDLRYHSGVAPGRIENGVLEAGPIDLRIEYKAQVYETDYFLRDAQIRMELLPDGGARGLVAGYWDLESLYRHRAGHRRARGAAATLGYMCSGLYHALPRLADGHPDPETGRCTSLSTVHGFDAVPAFVIHRELQTARSAADARVGTSCRLGKERGSV